MLLILNPLVACAATERSGLPDDRRIAEVARTALPGVVSVHTAGRMAQGSGAGFVCKAPDGAAFVITNHHVVWRAGEITVETNAGNTVRADVMGTDPETDLAVLRLHFPAKEDPPPLLFASTDSLRAGDRVVAIGSPGGVRNAVTAGIVAARGKVPNATIAGHDFLDYLFINTVVAAGSSGGPVLGMDGRVVGVMTGTVGGAQGLGIVLPWRIAAWGAEAIRRDGGVRHSASGLRVADATGDGLEGAVRVTALAGATLSPDGPFMAGDVIVNIDGSRLKGARDFEWREFTGAPGTRWTLDVVRNGRRMSTRLTLQPLTQEIFARRTAGQSPLGHQ